jgi:2-polyprenyl-3-methyl-5-hydroxy-6-metoxy-1,4-benzoquinol methylase
MINVRCNSCGSSRLNIIESIEGFKYSSDHYYNLVCCINCGLIFTDVETDEYFIAKNYPKNYKPHDPNSGKNSIIRKLFMSTFRKYIFGKRLEFRFLFFRLIRKFLFNMYNKTAYRSIPLFRDAGTLLDIGCGKGDYLRLVQEIGWRVRGVEPVHKAAELAKKAGFIVECKSFENVDFTGQYFDVVTMWHVLEHFTDPKEVLQKVSKILKDDGLLLIGIPNYDSFDRKIFHKYWNGFEIPLHLFHFTPESIKKTLTAAGFRCIKIIHTIRPTDMVSSLENCFDSVLKKKSIFTRIVFLLISIPVSFLFSVLKRSSIIVVFAKQ